MNALGYVLAVLILAVACWHSYWSGYWQQKYENLLLKREYETEVK